MEQIEKPFGITLSGFAVSAHRAFLLATASL
jgi:hypothetical protein